MAHKCPRCGSPVQRGYSSSAQATAGLVGAMFYAAFGAFECKKCGKIARSEFPPKIQVQMALISLLLIIVAIVVAIGAIWLINNK
jgi:hypothetical protein